MKNKAIFFLVYLFLVSLGFITVYLNIPEASIFTKTYITNIVQRVFGLTIFTMLFIQILLGMFMQKFTEKLGGWIYTFHIIHGITIYGLVVSHIGSFVLFNYFLGKGLDPFYAFVDICVMCKGKLEWYYNFGRISFWLLTTAVIAGYFRTSSFLRVHWRKFHILNYFVFLIAGVHSYFIGTDVLSFPYKVFYYISLGTVLMLTIVKIKGFLPEVGKAIKKLV